jgi:ribosomal protein S19E (S16A)
MDFDGGSEEIIRKIFWKIIIIGIITKKSKKKNEISKGGNQALFPRYIFFSYLYFNL